MLRFTAYIEYLLMTRHYCYVPGHGAYMLADEPADAASLPSIGAGSSRLYTLGAPRRVVHFSPLHTHDDGILANLLMEAEGMTFDEACRFIQRQAPLIPESFADEALAHTDTDNYGFSDLQLESWMDIEARLHPSQSTEAAEKVSTTTKAVTIQPDTITISRAWLQRVAMILLVPLFFFANFIGLNNSSSQLASIIDVSLLQNNAFISSFVEEEDDAEEVIPDYMPITAADLSLGKHYYIIISSTYSQDEATSTCRRYADQGFDHVGILSVRELFYVYTESFADVNEALRYLRSIRQVSTRLEKSWLLPLEGESLSSIIKNKYNDNQLSMELSHPNQRTERDQG